MLEADSNVMVGSRSYNLNGLTVSVIASDEALCTCLDSFLGPLATDGEIASHWEVRISFTEALPNMQSGQLVWEGDLPERLPSVLRRDGMNRNLLIRDHLALYANQYQKRIDVMVRRGSENVLRGSASSNIVAEIIHGNGQFLIHAACLLQAETDEALLIFAPSGRGKTTTSLALARSGWRLIGDDATILGINRNEPIVWALPRALNIRRRTEELLPWLANATKPWNGKDEQSLPLSSIMPFISHAAPAPRRCRAIVLLDAPNGSAHKLTRLDRSEALLRILADNLGIAPDGMDDQDKSRLDSLVLLAKHTTVLGLSVGPDIDTLSSRLEAACIQNHLANGVAVTS
jgi:hypothetical protein